MAKLDFKNMITNNFNDEVIYTTSTGRDLKNDVRTEAREQNKLVTDFKTKKV